MRKLLTYALKEGIITSILQVPNGEKCGCICPSCKEPLNAKGNISTKEYKKVAHFAHSSGSDCPGAYESALHLLAKKVFLGKKTLQLPDFHFDYNNNNINSCFRNLDKYEFNIVNQEQIIPIGEEYIRADIVATLDKTDLIIEFANSHFIDQFKKQKLDNLSTSCIEIDLVDQELDEEKLNQFFASKSKQIYWITNSFLDTSYDKYLKNKSKKEAVAKEAEYNEIKNSQLNVIKIQNNAIRICPKKINFYKYFKLSKYYTHPILKEIANGAYWNEKFYGTYSTTEYIFFKGEKIYTNIALQPGLNDQMSLLRNGLKQLLEKKSLDLKLCNYCYYEEGIFKWENSNFRLCNYKYENSFIKDI